MSIQEISKNQGIQVISRAATILRLLGQETDGLSLGQIATRVGLARSTVQRIVAALTVEGFISTDKGYGGIRLGPEIQSLAQAASTDIRDRLRPIMKRISDETGETVDLAILDGDKMLFIDQIVGSQRLRAVSSIGESFPLTTTANGKAALACMDPARATRLILAELESDTAKPLATILREVEDIRQGALARDESEHTDGVCALGLAIEDGNGDIYALSTPVPASRYARVKDRLTDAIHRHLSEPV
ncbi:IclR family transcriptional regulator [uncultured Tateyamaria sp.]|uniref:IclR family transcriptional regulator n=1 Tax=uncultured Tateyamaria sp. TaxID=455651 RepID=UPI002614EC1D|nr:IclR family transcriptional regulator [uncultured Tateyamaria sp.]